MTVNQCGDRVTGHVMGRAPAEAAEVKLGGDADRHHAVLLDEVHRHLSNRGPRDHHLSLMPTKSKVSG